VVGAAAQYAIYAVFLRAGLAEQDLELRRAALVRWTGVELAWQAIVVAAVGVYAIALWMRHVPGWAWVAPGVGAVLGTALPLQFAVSRILRAAR